MKEINYTSYRKSLEKIFVLFLKLHQEKFSVKYVSTFNDKVL